MSLAKYSNGMDIRTRYHTEDLREVVKNVRIGQKYEIEIENEKNLKLKRKIKVRVIGKYPNLVAAERCSGKLKNQLVVTFPYKDILLGIVKRV